MRNMPLEYMSEEGVEGAQLKALAGEPRLSPSAPARLTGIGSPSGPGNAVACEPRLAIRRTMDRTPMSERQQLALIKQLERSATASPQDPPTSPTRTPLQVVNGLNGLNSPLGLHHVAVTTPVAGSSPHSRSSESSPKTPLEDRIRKRLYRRNGKGETQLHRAAIKGHLMQCKKLLSLGIDPNVADNAGYTALHEACNRGNVAIVRLLVRRGADINLVGGVGEQRESPLHDAARNGHIEVVKLLVQKGANLASTRESNGQTPLDEAKNSRTKNPDIEEVVQYLTERQENSNGSPRDKGGDISNSESESNNEEVDITQDFTPLDQLKPNEPQVVTREESIFLPIKVKESVEAPIMEDKTAAGSKSGEAISSTTEANPSASTGPPPAAAAKSSDVYEFKANPTGKETAPGTGPAEPCEKKEAPTPLTSTTKDEASAKGKGGEKRGSDPLEEDEESRRKKRKEDPAKLGGRGTRGNSAEKIALNKAGTKSRLAPIMDRKSPTAYPNSAANSPKTKANEPPSDSDDDNHSKKSTDSSGLKVPPLKIVLSGNPGSGHNSSSNSPGSSNALPNSESDPKAARGNGSGHHKPYVLKEEEESAKSDERPNAGSEPMPSTSKAQDDLNLPPGSKSGTGSRVTRSRAHHQGAPGPSDSNDAQGNTSESSSTSAQEATQSTSEYHVRKRKLRSQGEENAAAHGHQNSGGSAGSSKVNEPLNDIEKFLNIRKAIEQRRKNCFPVQPKPPQGYEDYLMNRKTYLLEGNASSRLASMPKLKPPPSLKGELAELFVKQEEERYKLRCQHIVEKEKLVLNVEYEILRTHGRAARALANQSHPFSVCTMLKDEEIYNTIDPRQDEEKRDIRSRYNGRLFLSWCQDVDDKWEKIKEQVVLRHHNEAESLNAVQKCDWHDKVCEMKGLNPDDVPIQIDDLVIPMVHVSDDFDLSDSR